jgi:hypothetical protein
MHLKPAPLSLVLAASLTLIGCVPVHLSQPCRERISRCLETCPGRDGTASTRVREGGHPTVDARTECERSCHEACQEGPGRPSAFPNPDRVLPDKTTVPQ